MVDKKIINELGNRKRYNVVDFIEMVDNKKGVGKSPDVLMHIEFDIYFKQNIIGMGRAVTIVKYLLYQVFDSLFPYDGVEKANDNTWIASNIEDFPDWK